MGTDNSENPLMGLPHQQSNAPMSGAINEVARGARRSVQPGFDPHLNPAHLSHVLEGLHRYPNYLSRWSSPSTSSTMMDRLEQSLQAQLDHVRAQRRQNEQKCQDMNIMIQRMMMVNEKDDDATSAHQKQHWKTLFLQAPTSWDQVWDTILHPDAVKAIQASYKRTPFPPLESVLNGSADIELDALGPLTEWMDEEISDVFGFPLLSRSFCYELCEFVKAIERCHGKEAASTCNLDGMGLSWLNDLIFALIVKPMAKHLFPASEGQGLDWRNGYIAGYAKKVTTNNASNPTARDHLVVHTDDSEVTLNVCLGEEGFEGGDVEFSGFRGAKKQQFVDAYTPIMGRAILHTGRHFHSVTPVVGDKKKRFAWIMWARSWQGLRSHTCPCCWLNRRDQQAHNSCIAGPQWN